MSTIERRARATPLFAERRVEPELLDALPPSDPRAQRSRRDLRRVHKAMGTRRALARRLDALALCHRMPARIIELGAGDGTLLVDIATSLTPPWLGVEATLLDRARLVEPRTRLAFGCAGWRVSELNLDVLDWAAAPSDTRWNLALTSLFLHHFADGELRGLLRALAERVDVLVAWEPRRGAVSFLGSALVGALGANAVTRNDAIVSVRAGFRDRELSHAWPNDRGVWRLSEGAVGLFAHAFVAERVR